MANTSSIKFLDELIIKAISAIRKSQKRSDETRIYDSMKIFLENCEKMEILFIFRKQIEKLFLLQLIKQELEIWWKSVVYKGGYLGFLTINLKLVLKLFLICGKITTIFD